MTWTRRVWVVVIVTSGALVASSARSAWGQSDSRASIEADYAKRLMEVEVERINRLDQLSRTQQGAELAETLETLFRAAIGAQLFEAAEPVAERVIKSPGDSPVVDYLAAVINVLAEADRGEFEQSYQSILAAQHAGEKIEGGELAREHALPTEARITLLETYYQRLAQADQFPILRKALAAVGESASKTGEEAVAAFVADRIHQIDLIGKPAPEIVGVNQDGKDVRLTQTFKGDVVLVVFWATWCLPSAEQAAWLADMYDLYADKGFRVLGVNLDLHQDEQITAEEFEPDLRDYLIENNVRWPSIVDKPGPESAATRYGVTEIPASVLIGADGKVAHLDLNRVNADSEVAAALTKAGKLPSKP